MNHTVNIDIQKLLPENSKYFFESNTWIVQTFDPDITASGRTIESAIQHYWAQWGMDAYDSLMSAPNEDSELSDYRMTLRKIAYSYIELSHDKAAYQRDDFVKKAKETLEKHRKNISSPPVSVIERDF